MITEKEVSYTATNTYTLLNSYTDKTKNVWIVFHGMGYLSKYFLKYFEKLNAEENFIIAPQAPSKYYQDKDFKHVGASWLTRENTLSETENILNYIDAVFEKELNKKVPNLIVMGYSQGVSIALRWVASRKIQCNKLILHSGGIPKELKRSDFEFLQPSSSIIFIYGKKDPYINKERKKEESLKAFELFENRLKIEVFDGVHEVNEDILLSISD
ncbi:MAG: esterase [Aequorivita sp.]